MCARVCLCACVWGVMWRLIFYVVWCYDFLMCGVLVYIYIFFYYFWCVQQSACVCICFFTLLLFFLQFYYFCFTFMFFLHFYSFFFAFILYFALLYYFSLLLCLLNLQLTACMRQWLFALLVCFYVYLLCGKLWQQAVVFYVILIKFSGYQTPFFMHFLCTADFWFFLLFFFLLRQITLHNFNGASVWQQRARYFHASKCFRINFARCSCCWRSQQNSCAIFTFSGANNFRIYFRFSLTFSTSCFFQIIYLF